jgi:hypothetical protein
MLQCEPANIFRGAANDYNVRVMRCKQPNPVNSFINHVALIIKNETGYSPLDNMTIRKREYVEARQIMAAILCNNTKWTLQEIGAILGGKDHATILHSKDVINDLCDTDIRFREAYNRIKSKVTAI